MGGDGAEEDVAVIRGRRAEVKNEESGEGGISRLEPEFIVSNEMSSAADIAIGKETKVAVVATPHMVDAVVGARDGVLGLIRETAVTGRFRLPTGPEAALLAWEAATVVAMMLLLRAGVSSTLRWIHARISGRRGDGTVYEQSVFECMQRPLESVSVFTVATVIAETVTRPLAAAGLLRYLRTLRELGFIVCATWFLLRWIDRIRTRFAVDKRIDNAQVDATSRIATVVTVAVSVLVSLDTVGINVQTVLAFGGIGGVAIGFAGREIISNFFGGFMIYVTRPFTVGEWVRSIEEAELNGTVEDIGWYLTRVRTWDKRPLYIPNSRFSTLIVENGSRMSNRRILHTLQVRLEDVPALAHIVADLTKMLVDHGELDPRQHRMAYVDGFSTFSAEIWMSCYTKSVFLYDFRRVQQELLLNAHEIIRSHGARLASLNTRDVRPGIDVDRYGPFGKNASFRSLSNDPKVEDVAVPAPPPPPPQVSSPSTTANVTSTAPIPHIHANDAVPYNIESGVSAESFEVIASATTADENVTAAVVDGAAVEKNEKVPQRSTSEAAVAAAAAALAAAQRNAARIEEENAKESRKVGTATTSADGGGGGTGTMKISAASKANVPTAVAATSQNGTGDGGGSGTMKISAIPKSSTPSGASQAVSVQSGNEGVSTGAKQTTQSVSSENTIKKSAAPKTGASTTGTTSEGGGGGGATMKISTAVKPSSQTNENIAGKKKGTGKGGGENFETDGGIKGGEKAKVRGDSRLHNGTGDAECENV